MFKCQNPPYADANRLFEKTRLLATILILFCHSALNAQTGSSVENSDGDSSQSFSGNGKFYQIFPLPPIVNLA
jgi:hypothetical protein